MKHFLAETDFTREEAAALLTLAGELKATRGKFRETPLNGQSWGMLFSKSSTRTRVSFEVGLRELGANPIYLEQRAMQIDRGESLADTAAVLSRYLHGLIVRCHGHEVVEAYAEYGSVPVVNALTDFLHPCQIYSDLFTLTEFWGRGGDRFQSLAGRKLAFFGDCSSNMAHSWILGAAQFGMKIALAGPEAFQPKPEVDKALEAAGLPREYHFTNDAAEAADGADVLYTDVFVSMGREAEGAARLEKMRPYRVTMDLFEKADPEALFLHCLPAHLGEEVDEEVFNHPRSVVYDQAENRLHTQKAILIQLATARSMA